MSPSMDTPTFHGVEANTQTASYQPAQQQETPYAMNPSAYGQVYTPYSAAMPPFAQQQQQQQLGVPGQPMPPFSDAKRPPQTKAWAVSKEVLHAIGIVISIICFGLSLSTIGHNDAEIASYSIAPIAGLAFLWSSAEIITRIIRKREAGIHPGAHVALCLIIWLAAIILTALCGGFLAVDEDDYYSCDYENGHYGSNSNSTSEYENPNDCGDVWAGKKGVFAAAEIFIGLIWILYFVLFVLACIETSRRNKWNGRRLIYVPQPAWGMPGSGAGWQKMDQYSGGASGLQQQYQPVEQGLQAPPPMMQQIYHPQGTEYLGAASELSTQRDPDHGTSNSPSHADDGAADKGKARAASPDAGEGSSSSHFGGGGDAAPRGEVIEYYTPQP